MYIRSARRLLFGLIVTLLLVVTSACNIDQRETATIKNERLFAFDPVTLFSSIDNGGQAVFSPIGQEPELQARSQSEPVRWKQADYFRIAEALHEMVWGESLENWNLYHMTFSLGCDQTELGFQYAQFRFFQVRTIDAENARVEHFIEIDSAREFAQTMEVQYSPNLENRLAVDLETMKVSAEEALSIAEREGGSEERAAAENECGISVGISQEDKAGNWLVIYSPSIFTYRVDMVSGE